MEKLDDAGVGFIARTPMSFGFLSGSFTGEESFPPEDHRSRWSQQQIRLWLNGARDLQACCAESDGAPPHQIALRFCLSYAQVSTIIVGMLNAAEVTTNAEASTAGPLSRASCDRIEALHKTRRFVEG
jgi:aryl-alcohol dehydrogenase-like predicted oxidoreductase